MTSYVFSLDEVHQLIRSAHYNPRITGCYDSNGDAIWEGDVLVSLYDEELVCRVVWRAPRFELYRSDPVTKKEEYILSGAEFLRAGVLTILEKAPRDLTPTDDELDEVVEKW